MGGPSGLGLGGQDGSPFAVGSLLHQYVGLVRKELLLPPLYLGPIEHFGGRHLSSVVKLLFHLELSCQLMTTLVQCHLQLPLSGVEGIVVGIGGGSGGGDATTCTVGGIGRSCMSVVRMWNSGNRRGVVLGSGSRACRGGTPCGGRGLLLGSGRLPCGRCSLLAGTGGAGRRGLASWSAVVHGLDLG